MGWVNPRGPMQLVGADWQLGVELARSSFMTGSDACPAPLLGSFLRVGSRQSLGFPLPGLHHLSLRDQPASCAGCLEAFAMASAIRAMPASSGVWCTRELRMLGLGQFFSLVPFCASSVIGDGMACSHRFEWTSQGWRHPLRLITFCAWVDSLGRSCST